MRLSTVHMYESAGNNVHDLEKEERRCSIYRYSWLFVVNESVSNGCSLGVDSEKQFRY